jgi:hypothetical protein
MIKSLLNHRFALLFASLVFTMTIVPVVRALGVGPGILDVALAINLALAVFAATRRKRNLLLAPAVAAVFLVARFISTAVGGQLLLSASELGWVVFILLAIIAALRSALGRGPVNAERIFAALSVYLLAGLLFAVLYWIFEQTWPNSFRTSTQTLFTLRDAIYFSFVTLTTVGYGDVIAVADPARSFAVVQAVGGQLYLAVLVARLVSLHAREESR